MLIKIGKKHLLRKDNKYVKIVGGEKVSNIMILLGKKGSYDLQTQHELSKATETKYTIKVALKHGAKIIQIIPDSTG
jgi:hypothetical protein